ncbi:hypothetical protein [Breoghania sp. L-A4]|uniref:hypothetical protein n=1 Tax=Breoghania sp. L-A4 TaxID=2304600 RepID=UPI0013C2B9A4|nr:hypothetical protein [Breoghania sp. L-A4]
MSWSVRGVDNDAREWALEAAREAGVPVGEWLNGLIRKGAHAPQPQEAPRAHIQERSREAVRAKEPLRDRVERLSNTATAARRHAPAAPRDATAQDGDMQQVAEIARALDDLLGETRARGRAAPQQPEPRDTAPRKRTNNDTARAKRVERVLATLDNLDRRVRTLAGDSAASPQAATQTRDRARPHGRRQGRRRRRANGRCNPRSTRFQHERTTCEGRMMVPRDANAPRHRRRAAAVTSTNISAPSPGASTRFANRATRSSTACERRWRICARRSSAMSAAAPAVVTSAT